MVERGERAFGPAMALAQERHFEEQVSRRCRQRGAQFGIATLEAPFQRGAHIAEMLRLRSKSIGRGACR